MPRGGKRNGAGRKTGTPDRIKGKPEAGIILRGLEIHLTPLAVMLEAMIHYHEAGERAKAVEVARHAAPYVHPRLTAVAIRADDREPEFQQEE